MKKGTKSIWLVMLVLVLLAAATGTASAAVFTMEGVPQDVGILDAPYGGYTEAQCRACHGGGFGTADVHHLSATALDAARGCIACHTVDPNTNAVLTPINRDCKSCHDTSAHHVTQNAMAGNCTFCHDPNLLSDQGTGFLNPPQYSPSLVTPDPHACANCHIEFNLNWDESVWPIDPGHTEKDPNEISHHGALEATVDNECAWCHDESVPPMVEAPIRMCESCHTIPSLHAIDGHISSNDRCAGCHSDYMVGTTVPEPSQEIPVVSSTDKASAKRFEYVTITGQYFNNLTDQGSAYIAYTDTLGEEISVLAPASYWTDTEASVMVPNLAAANYYLYVTTTDGKRSNTVPFTVVESPTIASLTPAVQKAGTTITINGKGFNIGGAAVVQFTASGTTTTVTPSQVVSNDQLTVVVPGTMAVGKYAVTVKNNFGTSNSMYFTVAETPKLNFISPNNAAAGKTITLTGSYLSLGTKPVVSLVSSTSVTTPATVGTYSATKVYFTVPAVAKGAYKVKLNNSFADSNLLNLTVK